MNLIKLFNTVKYLKPIQWWYRLKYVILKTFSQKTKINFDVSEPRWLGKLTNPTFTFLNITHTFEDQIDWNQSSFGKLWTYNLNYFEFIDEYSEEEGMVLIHDFILSYNSLKDGLEAYPTSLRIINWVKFVQRYNISDELIYGVIETDATRLSKNIEYHLLGNHVLENGFGLLFASVHLANKRLLKHSISIIREEINEEYHDDGCHFEQSPMYHSILLERILDSIKLLQDNKVEDQIIGFLEKAATNSLAFLEFISVNNETPQFNDAAIGVSKLPKYLFQFAKELNIEWKELEQGKGSGFRKYHMNEFTFILDSGSIGPDYQPGHAHADSLSFVLYYNGEPIIVDTGTSTYETNDRRKLERSTFSHNTVTFDQKNSSEVWGGFRVARRAKTKTLDEFKDGIEVSHNGYARYGVDHTRKVRCLNNKIVITDYLKGNNAKKSISCLHFHPNVQVTISENSLILNGIIRVNLVGFKNIQLLSFYHSPEFNKLIKSVKFIGEFTEKSQIEITSI